MLFRSIEYHEKYKDANYHQTLFEYDYDDSEDELQKRIEVIYNYYTDTEHYLRSAQNMGLL